MSIETARIESLRSPRSSKNSPRVRPLRPAALDQLGLEPALLALADRVRRAGLEVDCQIELAYAGGHASERLIDELEVGVYRIVQEALTNSVKHGAAAHARVQVVERDDHADVIDGTVRHGANRQVCR